MKQYTTLFILLLPGLLAGAYILTMQTHPPELNIGYFGTHVKPPKPTTDFTLTDHTGKDFSLHTNSKNKITLLTFGFTHCPDVCPETLFQVSKVIKQLPPKIQPHVSLVFVSVDPERDPPETLNAYIPFFHKNFTGLTGTPEHIARIAKDYGIFYEKEPQPRDGDPDYYTVNHSTQIQLLDQNADLAILYKHNQIHSPEKIAEDIIHIWESPPEP